MFAGLVWIFPQVNLWSSTLEFGFRGVLVVCGMASLLVSLRMLDGKHSPLEFAVLGVVVGLGWWASPEIVYFLIPAGLIFVGSLVAAQNHSRSGARYWVIRVGLGLGAFLVGCLPWLWDNSQSGFASLKSGSFQVPPGSPGYVGRLRSFFEGSFPMQLNLREPQTGTWWYGAHATAAITVVIGIVLLAGVAWTAAKGGRWLAVAVGALAFPFVLAIFPATWFWQDGRYTASFILLLTLSVAPAFQDLLLKASSLR